MRIRSTTVSTPPFLHEKDTTPRIMYEVLISLIPAVLIAFYFFGLSALLLVFATSAGCLLTEWIFTAREKRLKALKDGSALLTGVLLALCLPPGFSMWMAFLGGVVAIGMGKAI